MLEMEFLNHILNSVMERLQQASEQLTAAEKFNRELDAIIENSYDGIAIVNAKGITVRVNPAWERLTGMKDNEVVGKCLKDLVREGVFSESVALRALSENKTISIMQRCRTGKQTFTTGTPIKDEQGQITHVVINMRDITELYSLKVELEETKDLTERYHWEINELRQQVLDQNEVIAVSKKMLDLLELTIRVSKVDSTVLLLGESGVGKEVVAKIIHKSSNRAKSGSFIKLNCGAIPAGLLESELFGYEEGAFTGAKKQGKPGMFQLASGGTLFLDEIGELPLELQVKLLRVLQEQEVVPLGGVSPVKVDVRIIAATNQDLLKRMEEGKFRQDLYYRLNVVSVEIPPLRKRKEDIPALINHFLNKFNEKYGLRKHFAAETIKIMLDYDWPGNVRQLANVVEGSMITSRDNQVGVEVLPGELLGPNRPGLNVDEIMHLNIALEMVEKSLIERAIAVYGTTYEAAKALGVSQASVARKAKKYRENA